MKLIGIDYSYTSPAIAFMEYKNYFLDFLSEVTILHLSSSAKKFENWDKRLYGIDFPMKFSGIKRFSELSHSVSNFCFRYDGCLTLSVAIEDYSFGSHSGRNFTIGENCGILKSDIYKQCNFLRLYSPTLIKRFVKEQNEELAAKNSDGKLKKDGTVRIGALNKKAMHEIFCCKFGVDLVDYFEVPFKKYQSPLSDIVDALWILYLHWCEWKIRNNNIECLTDQEIKFIKEGVNGEGFHKRPFEF